MDLLAVCVARLLIAKRDAALDMTMRNLRADLSEHFPIVRNAAYATHPINITLNLPPFVCARLGYDVDKGHELKFEINPASPWAPHFDLSDEFAQRVGLNRPRQRSLRLKRSGRRTVDPWPAPAVDRRLFDTISLAFTILSKEPPERYLTPKAKKTDVSDLV